MDMARIFGLPAALLVIAVVANRLSRWTRVPDIIVLLLIGVGLGPVLKWVDPSHFDATIRILGMLALILILFEGGLELRLKDAIRYSPGGILLAFVGYGFTLTLVALIVRQLLHMSWSDGVLVGAVLGSTSAAVVLPAIEQISAPEPVKIILTLESSLGEIIAVLMVGTLISLGSDQSLVEGLITGFGHHILIDVAIGASVGVIWSRLWPLVAGQHFSNALNLGTVLGVFAVGRYFGGSGLLAELEANMPRTPEDGTSGGANAGVSFRAHIPGSILLFCAVGNHGEDGLQGIHHPNYCDFSRSGSGALARRACDALVDTRCQCG